MASRKPRLYNIDECCTPIATVLIGTSPPALVKQSKKIPPEVMTSISSIEDPSRLVDTIASQLTCKLDIKQKLLEMLNIQERIEFMRGILEGELELFNVEKRFD